MTVAEARKLLATMPDNLTLCFSDAESGTLVEDDPGTLHGDGGHARPEARQMNTFDMAWAAFARATEETREQHERNGDPCDIAELLRHASELIDVMWLELLERTDKVPPKAGFIVERLRDRFNALRLEVVPARH